LVWLEFYEGGKYFRDRGIPLGASPGACKIFAWQVNPAGVELHPEFIQPYEKSGVPIVVTADSTTNGIVVSLIPNAQ